MNRRGGWGEVCAMSLTIRSLLQQNVGDQTWNPSFIIGNAVITVLQLSEKEKTTLIRLIWTQIRTSEQWWEDFRPKSRTVFFHCSCSISGLQTAACASVCLSACLHQRKTDMGEGLHAFFLSCKLRFEGTQIGVGMCKHTHGNMLRCILRALPTLARAYLETHLKLVFQLQQSVTLEYCAHWCGQMWQSSQTGNMKLHTTRVDIHDSARNYSIKNVLKVFSVVNVTKMTLLLKAKNELWSFVLLPQ